MRQGSIEVGRRVSERASERLEDLYRAHAPRAKRLAYLLVGDEALAEEVTQDAFLKLFTRFYDLRDEAAFPAYLRRTIVNLSRNVHRRRKLERDQAQRMSADHAEQPDIEERDAVLRAVRTLPYRQRVVVVLRYFDDLSEQQSVDVMGVSVAAVKSLMRRANAALRQELREEKTHG